MDDYPKQKLLGVAEKRQKEIKHQHQQSQCLKRTNETLQEHCQVLKK